ncbi:hypothetical protein KSD_51090 [Ktedonobacter sp. SOSP1-85]|uniref:hypothetical protein n=1 Tax=Ktedonobacter sp. SOSP1-85 TaxID=2778367 RepID=UPI0019150F4A|nr:hypothetical protein [Ktedonobacter sp. SOSP1-85]GHO77338.1 hypothetical protein KSD_51090 [Ktedonobacter sp. SOSP1-85]
MEAIIGRYRAQVQEQGVTLRHISGIAFDISAQEALGLLDLLSAYRETLQQIQEQQAQGTTDSSSDPDASL